MPADLVKAILRARDNAGNLSDNSDNRAFIVDTAGPDKMTLYSPDNNATAAIGTTAFEWYHANDSGSGGDHYWIQIDNEPSFGRFELAAFRPVDELTVTTRSASIRLMLARPVWNSTVAKADRGTFLPS